MLVMRRSHPHSDTVRDNVSPTSKGLLESERLVRSPCTFRLAWLIHGPVPHGPVIVDLGPSGISYLLSLSYVRSQCRVLSHSIHRPTPTCSLGRGISILRSRRPGRSSAGSSVSGRFVAMIILTLPKTYAGMNMEIIAHRLSVDALCLA